MIRHRIYIASPYSHEDPAVREANVARSVEAAAECMRRGHMALSPLAATHPVAALAPDLGYERWMEQDFTLIRHWATALLYLASSPGADREVEYAENLGRRVFLFIDEVPDLRGMETQQP